ncbi:hypothetical protein NDU88_001018 [Pleurodeles waltl]|uniref:Uncharacterized protein n=1 Tax=Pleurodeles waltl TaxID=8319 RepID=A0AAV7NDY4_PLEWA|nr:hypothetical protein NDU88_001018 [Pleurodeles waltl]
MCSGLPVAGTRAGPPEAGAVETTAGPVHARARGAGAANTGAQEGADRDRALTFRASAWVYPHHRGESRRAFSPRAPGPGPSGLGHVGRGWVRGPEFGGLPPLLLGLSPPGGALGHAEPSGR